MMKQKGHRRGRGAGRIMDNGRGEGMEDKRKVEGRNEGMSEKEGGGGREEGKRTLV